MSLKGIIFIATSLSCFALPVKADLVMLSGYDSYITSAVNNYVTGDEKTETIKTIPKSGWITPELDGLTNTVFYTFDTGHFEISFPNQLRNYSPKSGVNIQGQIYFTTTVDQESTLQGSYNTFSILSDEVILVGYLHDLTAGESLFENMQWSVTDNANLVFGGNVGNRSSFLSGNLINQLFKGHVYRFMFNVGASNPESYPDFFTGNGSISLSLIPVPVPISFLLFSCGLGFIASISTRNHACRNGAHKKAGD